MADNFLLNGLFFFSFIEVTLLCAGGLAKTTANSYLSLFGYGARKLGNAIPSRTASFPGKDAVPPLGFPEHPNVC